jgi:hypothetical protein
VTTTLRYFFLLATLATGCGSDPTLLDGGPDHGFGQDSIVADTASDVTMDVEVDTIPEPDTVVPDTIAMDTVDTDTTTDTGGVDSMNFKQVQQACCVTGTMPCSYGYCAAGLTCYVLPGGPYGEYGVCCPAGDCLQSCDPNNCAGGPGMCAKGELCPPELTCRSVMGYGFCIP